MLDAFKHFFNWQSDSDWFWGPLLSLRPPRNMRMTLRFWLRMIGIVALFTIPVEAVSGSLLAYYDYAAAKHHEPKIPPVTAAEHWMNMLLPQAVLRDTAVLLAVCVFGCLCQHWAWNRRADRLNREAASPDQLAAAEAPGVWPPPLRTMC